MTEHDENYYADLDGELSGLQVWIDQRLLALLKDCEDTGISHQDLCVKIVEAHRQIKDKIQERRDRIGDEQRKNSEQDDNEPT